MFSSDERDRLREQLISVARTDTRIIGAAITGSAAIDNQDRWSDIDLAFGVAPDVDVKSVITDWTDRMYREHGALHHLDVVRGAVVYRVFLLDSTLQVDIAFAPGHEFAPIGPKFRLLFGNPASHGAPLPRDTAQLIGWGWLYALHARSSILRNRHWQAEYMISGARDQVLALACLRHGLPTAEGRGFDCLPIDITAALRGGLVRSTDANELNRAFRVVVEALLDEIRQFDPILANCLKSPLNELVTTVNEKVFGR